MPRYLYHAWVLEELEPRGIRPRPHTPPAKVRELLNDLYRLELRRLRSAIVAAERLTGERRRSAHSEAVTTLRESYPLLRMPVETWVEAEKVRQR